MLAGFTVTTQGAGAVLEYAAAELRRHLRMAGTADGGGDITIESGGGGGDAFAVTVAPGHVRITGDNERGALNGVYWLLEQVGFGWVEPGERGVAFAPGRTLIEGKHRESPAFPRRTLILGQDALHDDWRQWLEFASRNRLNSLFFHDTPPSRPGRANGHPPTAEALETDGGGWLFERWRDDGAEITAAASQRGMSLQFGGHHLPTLVPRAEFAEHPDWFPLRRDARDARYNLCVSSPGAVERLGLEAVTFVERFPGAAVYHFWADDIRGGGWCECAGCGVMSPSDQALLATNAVARALRGSGARVAHLAYHDTVVPPAAVIPDDDVQLLWAPRERCYAHPIAEATCTKNGREYWEPFTGLVRAFGGGVPRVQAFEYFSDAILFKGLTPPHLGALPADAGAYAAAGVFDFQDLVVADRPWVGPPWHAWWFSRCAWNPATEAARALRQFCALAYGEASEVMARYYERLERAYRGFLDLHDLARASRHDVLDFSDSPRATLRVKAAEALAGAEEIAACGQTLDGLSGDGPGRVERERVQAGVCGLAARHLAERTAAWSAALDGDNGRAGRHLSAAREAFAGLTDWDAAWNSAAYSVITAGVRRGMRFHLDTVARLCEGRD